MPRMPSATTRITLYRLTDLPRLRSAITDKYLQAQDQFTATALTVEGRETLLVVGTMITTTARWAPTVASLTGQPVDVGNRTAAGALLIRDTGRAAWALTFGMGFHLLDARHVDPAFGQRLAIRLADPAELSSISRTTLDARPRVDRLSIPSGEHVRGFGLSDVGELVTRLVGRAHHDGLTASSATFTIRGADSVSLPLGRTASALLSDLDALSAVLSRPPHPELAPLEQLVALKPRDPRLQHLQERLSQELGSSDTAAIGLAWPTDRADEFAPTNSFCLTGAGRDYNGDYDGIVALEHLLAPVRELPVERRLDRLKTMRVQLFSDADEATSSAIPAFHWLAYETHLDRARYCLQNGRWYLMDQRYAERLRTIVRDIFARPSPITMPDWAANEWETTYNKRAARELRGLFLDRKLARTDAHPHGIEICDILAPDGSLIHVKNIDEGSSTASHLIAQAFVSAEAMRYDEEARRQFEEAVVAAGGSAAQIRQPVRTLILAMARKRPLTAESLFTFTQVTLARGVTALQVRGIDVFVAPILKLA